MQRIVAKDDSLKPLAEEIVRRLVEGAIRRQYIRQDMRPLYEDGALEVSEGEMVQDALALALGEDTGCLGEEEINVENIDLLFVEAKLRELINAKINTPSTGDFIEAVKLEAAHQRGRWAAAHDSGKADSDWFWLIGYLGGKALRPGQTPEKRLHHIITTAAVCLNWYRHATGEATEMRPGIADPESGPVVAVCRHHYAGAQDTHGNQVQRCRDCGDVQQAEVR